MDGREQPAIAFDGFFLRFAKGLADIPTGETPLGQGFQEMASQFMEYILDTYASRCVGPKPTPPKGWQRRQCGCGCTDCIQLFFYLILKLLVYQLGPTFQGIGVLCARYQF